MAETRAVAAEMAVEQGLPLDWLNMDARPWIPRRDPGADIMVVDGDTSAPLEHLAASRGTT